MIPAQRSVLIVDQSSESREVLRTALQREGAQIYEASRGDEGLEMARSLRPNLIVLDLELETVGATDLSADFHQTAEANNSPLVVLATARRRAQQIPSSEFVAKPYHFGPLVRRIEELLGERS